MESFLYTRRIKSVKDSLIFQIDVDISDIDGYCTSLLDTFSKFYRDSIRTDIQEKIFRMKHSDCCTHAVWTSFLAFLNIVSEKNGKRNGCFYLFKSSIEFDDENFVDLRTNLEEYQAEIGYESALKKLLEFGLIKKINYK